MLGLHKILKCFTSAFTEYPCGILISNRPYSTRTSHTDDGHLYGRHFTDCDYDSTYKARNRSSLFWNNKKRKAWASALRNLDALLCVLFVQTYFAVQYSYPLSGSKAQEALCLHIN